MVNLHEIDLSIANTGKHMHNRVSDTFSIEFSWLLHLLYVSATTFHESILKGTSNI